MKINTLFTGSILLLSSFEALAVVYYPPCDVDCPTTTIQTTSSIYNLAGTANIYDANGSLLIPAITATGTLTYSTWYDSITGEGGENALININALDLGSALAPIVSSYSWETSSTGLVTDYTIEYFGYEADSTLFDSTNSSQWNYLIGGIDPASVYTLDNNFDSIPGVRALIMGGAEVTIDYQLSQVPVPAAIWLFASGIAMLAGISRRRAT